MRPPASLRLELHLQLAVKVQRFRSNTMDFHEKAGGPARVPKRATASGRRNAGVQASVDGDERFRYVRSVAESPRRKTISSVCKAIAEALG